LKNAGPSKPSQQQHKHKASGGKALKTNHYGMQREADADMAYNEMEGLN